MRIHSLLSSTTVAIVLASGALAASIATAPAAYAAEAPSRSTYKKFRKAAYKNDIEKLEKYLAKYPDMDVNLADKYGTNALHHAASEGSAEAVLWLLQHGADANSGVAEIGTTALMHLTGTPWDRETEKRLDVVKALIKAGANVKTKTKDTNETALMFASANDLGPIVDLLLAQGASVDSRTKTGETPLLYTVSKYGHIKNSPLQVNNIEIMKKLIAAGSDVNAKDNESRSALHFIATSKNSTNRAESMRYLASQGANLHYKSADRFSLRDIAKLNSFDAELDKFLAGRGIKFTDAFEQEQQEQVRRTAAAELERKQKNPATHQCEKTKFENLTPDESVAMKYAVIQDLEVQGVNFGKQCITKIIAKSKVPFRGNTLVKYRVNLHYPFGYKADCLKLDKNAANNLSKQWDWNTYEQITTGGCNSFSNATGGKPIEVGGARHFEGETEI